MKKYFLLSFFLIISILFGASISFATNGEIEFTESERTFIENNPVIRLGVDPNFIPFEFIDENGEYKGIAADYLQLISEKTGLQFEVQKDLTWQEAYELVLSGQLDAFPAIGKTPEREEDFIFSAPYHYFKRVIVTNDSDRHISSIEDLTGLTVAVQKNSSHHSYLVQLENINLSLYDSVEAALVAVATGEEEAFIGNLATTDYLIRSNGLANLRFVSFEAEKQQALHFAARKDLPELITIIDKALATITEQEKAEINNKWVDLETKIDLGPYIRYATIIGAIFLVILIISLFWIKRLRNEIAQREILQNYLMQSRQEIQETNEKLQKANEELEKMTMIDGLTGIFNRRYFDSFLEKLWEINMREKFPVTLIMIDIDKFKSYNDTYGHLAGDECLKTVAKLIDETIERQGDFVARYGGEEFAVLLSNTPEKDAAILAEKIRKKVEQTPINNGVTTTNNTISLGVASMISTATMSSEQLIDLADKALYEAKNNGRNRVELASNIENNEK